jgi:sugar phosphate permease
VGYFDRDVLAGYVIYFRLSWLPSYLVSERGLSMTSMALLGSVPFWAMAVSSVTGGWSSDRWIRSGADPGKVRKFYSAGGLILCAVTIVPAPLVGTANSSVVLITLSCIALGMFTSNVWAITQTLAGPEAAGRWTGVQNAIGNLGGIVSPAITGWVVAQSGSFTFAFAAAAAVLAAGADVYLLSIGSMKPVRWASGSVTQAVTA